MKFCSAPESTKAVKGKFTLLFKIVVGKTKREAVEQQLPTNIYFPIGLLSLFPLNEQ